MADQPNTKIPPWMLGNYDVPENIDLYSESGRSGLIQYAGYVREEILPELSGRQWRRIAKQMLWNDPIIAAMFLTVEILCRQVKFDITPGTQDNEGEQTKDFIKEAIFEDMNQPFTETLSETLTMLPWGWHYAEMVFKKRQGPKDDGTSSVFNDGKIGFRKWAPRAQETLLHWAFDQNGDVKAMVQLSPPDWKITPIPIEKSLLFRTSTNKANPEGRSLLRLCYDPYYRSSLIQNLEGIGIERDAAGIPWMSIPVEYMGPKATDAQKAIYAQAQNIVTNMRNNQQAGAVIPSDPFKNPDGTFSSTKMFELNLLKSGGSKSYDTSKVLDRLDRRKLMILLADFIVMGHEKVGSFALADKKTEIFADACGGYLDAIIEVINRYAIPRLLKVNGMSAEKPPKMIHGDIENVDPAEIGNFIMSIAKAGINVEPIAKQSLIRAGYDVPDDAELMAPQPTPGTGAPGGGVGDTGAGQDLGEYPEGDYQQPDESENDESALTMTEINGRRKWSFPSQFGGPGSGPHPGAAAPSVPSVRGVLSRAGIAKGRASSAGFTIDHGAKVEQKLDYVRVTHIGKGDTDAELNKYKDVLESKGFKVDMVDTKTASSTRTVPRLEITPASATKQFSMPNSKSSIKLKDVNSAISSLKRMRMDEAISLLHAGELKPNK